MSLHRDYEGNEVSTELLSQQKRELTILSAIIQTVSNSYNLKETLEGALDIILKEIGSSTGWICLLGEDHSCAAFVGHKGLCFTLDEGETPPCLVHCVCDRVRQTGEIVMIRHLKEGCPLLQPGGQQSQSLIGHVSVPLTTQSRIVGQLNVAFTQPQQADQMDIELLKSIGPQLAVAVENARLWSEVQAKEQMRKELLKRIVTAQEEERSRISRELHDELGQELTSLLVRLQVLETSEKGPRTDDLIRGIKTTVSQILSSIHDLALELRPPSLDDLGLVPALAQYTKTCPEYLGLEVDLAVVGINGQRLPREVETTLYRAVQESLTNVSRHAGVKRASVLLKKNGSSVVAIIEDRGVGFDAPSTPAGQAYNRRLGLYGMEERVSIVGGTLTVESTPGSGTTIYVKIPLEP